MRTSAEIRKQIEKSDDVTLESLLNNSPPDGVEWAVTYQLMRERGVGGPGILARIESFDRDALIAHRLTVVDNEVELGVVDELLAAFEANG